MLQHSIEALHIASLIAYFSICQRSRALIAVRMSQALSTAFWGDDLFSPFYGLERSVARASAGGGSQFRGIALDVIEVSTLEDMHASSWFSSGMEWHLGLESKL